MAQFTWTGNVNDDYNNASNWDPTTGPPGFGDTVFVAFGTVEAAANQIFSDNYIAVGSTTGPPATLVFDNDATTGLSNPTIADSTVSNSVPGETTAAQAVLDANGTFVNQGTLIADAASGSTYTIDVDENGGNPGFFVNQGVIEADAGNTLDIVVGATSEILNSGLILANGGSILITTSGSGQIVGGYAPVVGLVAIQGGGTVEFNAALPYDPTDPDTTSGPRYYFAFEDGAGDLLKLDQVTQFSGNILGFEQGDTIDLGSLVTITSLTYSQYGILTLSNNSGVVASLDLPGDFATGSFSVVGGIGGSFTIGASGGDTVITTEQVNDTWTGDGTDSLWSDADNWSGGIPAATGVAVIGNGTAQTYTVSTGSASVGALILNNPDATLDVDGMFQVFPGSYVSTVSQVAGTIQIDSGDSAFIYALRQFGADTVLDLQTGASLLIEGRPSTQLTSNGTIDLSSGGNRFALGIEGSATVDGATINAGPGQTDGDGGSIYIGQDGAGTPATMIVETDGITPSSVTDTYAVVYSSPTSYGSLTITGAGTVWDDAGDPSDTENTRGYMLIGENDQDSNTPTPPYAGTAQLTVSDQATLEEASLANIGNTVDSSGNVTIDDATWDIGNTGTTGTPIGFLQVGRYGAGALTIEDGGTVAIGAGGTIVNDGTSQTVNYSVDIGHYAGATGTLVVEGTGSALTALNSVIVGDSGAGAFTVENTAYASIGGNFDIGGNAQGADGGTGTVSVATGGEIEVGANLALALWAGSTISVDGASAIDVGGSGTYVDGAINIDSGSALRGDGVVDAAVVDDGAIHATNDGTYSASTGGFLDITGSVTGTGIAHITNGATLEIGGTIAASQQITFDANSGLAETFILGTAGTGLASQVNDLQDFDRIELGGLTITGATFSNGTVTVTTTGSDYLLTDVHIAPDASTGFTTGTDGSTGFDYIQVTCFATGTRIATPDGEVPVERLSIGQHVITVLDGRPQPILWIGHLHIDCRRHPNPAAVWPVRIRAGAFGPGLPARDLFVSPDHALLIDGVLIPAKYLLNGGSVAQIPMDAVTYHHIELASHDAVLAEGVPAETYLDTDGRASFDNRRAPTRPHPDLSSLLWEAKGCAPLVVTGPILAAACARLGAAPAAAARSLAA